MGIINLYLFISLVTAITSLFCLYYPVLQLLDKDCTLVENKVLGYLVFFCIAFIVSPLIILTMFIPGGIEVFIDSMVKGINKK